MGCPFSNSYTFNKRLSTLSTEELADVLSNLSSSTGVRRKNRFKVRRLAKQFMDLVGGEYTLERHPSLYPQQREEIEPNMHFDLEGALQKRLVSFQFTSIYVSEIWR